MQVTELIQRINTATDDLDFVTARKYIEENLTLLADYRHLLNTNARELYQFLNELKSAGFKPVSRQEMAIIQTVNMHASKFDIRGIRLLIEKNPQLFLRKDIYDYFHQDARTILQSIGVMSSPEKEEN